MSVAEDTAAQLAALQQQVTALQAQLGDRPLQTPQDFMTPEMATLLAQGGGDVLAQLVAQRAHPALDTPPKSTPIGWAAGDPRPMSVRRREMAVAKMEQRAKNSGGRYDPEGQSRYGHREGCDHKAAGAQGWSHECQRKCWTPEREARELAALRLPLDGRTLVPLTPPEKPGQGSANDVGQALLGALQKLVQGEGTTPADTLGQYPSREESEQAGPGRRRIRASV